MMQAELAICIAALALLLVLGLWVAGSYRTSKPFWLAVGAAALVFVIRWSIAEPTFVHASLHGPRLIEHPYQNPYESFRGYGPLAPLVHGLLLRWRGPDLTQLALLHQLCLSFALVPMAWLASRLTGSRVAMVGTFAVAALHPVLVRIGASEDAHAIAVLLAWIGFAAMVDYADREQKSRLLLATAALVLMLHTRQIMLALLPFAFVLALAQRRSLIRDPWFLGSAAVCVAAIVLRFAVLADNPDQTFHLRSIPVRLASLDTVVAAFVHHPLFDLGAYQPLFVPLWLIGAVTLWRRSPLGRWFVVFFVAQFVATFWTYEGLNVALMFRMPLLTIACVLAGVGFAQLIAAAARRWGPRRSDPIAAVAAGLIAVVPLVMPGWRIVAELRPLTHEYRQIQASPPLLPERFVLLIPPGGGMDRPAYDFPTHLLRVAGLEVEEQTPQDVVRNDKLDEPLLFFRGDACYAYSLIELSNLPALDFETIIRAIGTAAANHEIPEGLVVPAVMRPECVALLRNAELIGELVEVPARPLDVPFVLYGVETLEMGFYRLDPEAVRAAAALADEPR